MWPISAVVVDLPLVPVIAMTRRAPVLLRARRGSRARTVPCRRSLRHRRLAPGARRGCGSGWVSGTPGLRISALISSHGQRSHGSSAIAPSRAAWRAASLSSQANTRAPPAFKRARRRQAGARQPEDADCLFPEELLDRDHRPHRSFNVESPISASTTAMIQKRITMVGSLQPSCSK